jgi:hypothetical protein
VNGRAAVRNAELRAGAALQTMTDDEGLSLREARRFAGAGIIRIG